MNHFSLFLAPQRAGDHPAMQASDWFAAAIKVHDRQHVQQMLPSVISCICESNWTALHIAALHDHELVVAQLLADHPDMARVVEWNGRTALRLAVQKGHEKVVALLLAKNPGLANETDTDGVTSLHCAASSGRYQIAEQLLAANPGLVNAVDFDGWTILHSAARFGRKAITAQLASTNPQLTSASIDAASRSFFVRLLELNPAALRAVTCDSNSGTPFDIAVAYGNDSAIEVMQGKLSLDEILHSMATHKTSSSTENLEARFIRPVLERQCEDLTSSSLLNRDVLLIVFEYLGLVQQQGKNNKRKHFV